MGESLGGASSIPDELGHMRSELHSKYEKLRPGEHVTDVGRCYVCGQIELTEGEDHQYFVVENGVNYFVSKDCWAKRLGKEVDKHPVMNPKKLRKD